MSSASIQASPAPLQASTAPLPRATSNPPYTGPENRVFYPALDGLRALAFLMVWAQHYLRLPWGWAGVDLFFVLSGFLITGILWDTREDHFRVRNFYVRRTLRIFPLFYGIMFMLLLLQPLAHWDWNWRWLVWPLYVGNMARFIQPFAHGSALQHLADFQPWGWLSARLYAPLYLGHFWSLCVEEQFYLLWPWAVFFLRDRRTLMVLCALSLAVCLGLRLAGAHTLPSWMLENEILYRLLPFRLDALLLGGLLALWMRGPAAAALLRVARLIVLPTLLGLVGWMLLSPFGHLWRGEAYVYPAWKFTWGLTAVDGLAALLILLAIQPGTALYRGLSLRPLRWLGRISYGAYVFHDIPHELFRAFMVKLHHDSDWAVAGLALAFTCVAASLSFRFFESPFLHLKERWTVKESRARVRSARPVAPADGTQGSELCVR